MFPSYESVSELEHQLTLHYGRSRRLLPLLGSHVGREDSMEENEVAGHYDQHGNQDFNFLALRRGIAIRDGAREYVDACLAMRVRVKMQVVQQLLMLSQEMQAFLCDHYCLKAKDGVAIAAAINTNTLCTLLSLSHNTSLKDEGRLEKSEPISKFLSKTAN